jgi:hypothetical protein
MDEALTSHDPFCRAPCNRPDGTVLPQPSDELRVPAHCDRMELLTIKLVQPLHKSSNPLAFGRSRAFAKEPYGWDFTRLLRAHCERPNDRAAEE